MFTRALQIGVILAAALTLGACATPPRMDPAWAPTMPIVQAAPPPADGAIFHVGRGMGLFADPRARRVGDILTIVLAESMQASKKAATSTSKKDNVDIGAATLWGETYPLNGGKIAGLSADRGFDGEGASTQSNQLHGEITVTVTRRLANGNLVVRGQKWVTINQGSELVRLTGIVRPADISPDNTVISTRVANARISYTGRGALADANHQGWLSRLFNSPWWPF